MSAVLLGCSALITYMQVSDFLYSIMSFNESFNHLQESIWAPNFSFRFGIWYGVYAFNAGEEMFTQCNMEKCCRTRPADLDERRTVFTNGRKR